MKKKILLGGLLAIGSIGACIYAYQKKKELENKEDFLINNGQVLELDKDPFFQVDPQSNLISGQAERVQQDYSISPTTPKDAYNTQISHS